MSSLARYALFQVPGQLCAALLAFLLWEWADLPGWAAAAVVAAWVAKDLALYPLLRRAYELPPRGAEALLGRRGIARRRLAPRGTVAFGAELWRAEIAPRAVPVEAGTPVRVVGARGLVLIVAPDEPASDRG